MKVDYIAQGGGAHAQHSEGYDQNALDAASREVHMMLLREGSNWGTKACEEMGRVFMTAYRKALPTAAPAATPPEFETLRLYWNACETNNEAPAYGRVCSILAELHARLERENADLRGKLEQAQKDAERYRWVLPILNGDGHEGDERAFAIAAQLLKGLNGDAAIDAAKEASNG